MFSMPLACTSSSSMLMMYRFGLLMASHWSCHVPFVLYIFFSYLHLHVHLFIWVFLEFIWEFIHVLFNFMIICKIFFELFIWDFIHFTVIIVCYCWAVEFQRSHVALFSHISCVYVLGFANLSLRH
jgi:hypothetical protein